MLAQLAGFWTSLGAGLHLTGAIACAAVAIWLFPHRSRFAQATQTMVVALAATAIWCITVAVTGPVGPATVATEGLRDLTWFFAIYRLFASDGRHQSLAPLRPVLVSLAFVELVAILVGLSGLPFQAKTPAGAIAFDFLAMFRLLSTVGALVLVHNLYAGMRDASRPWMRWPATALGILWLFDLNLFTIAYLSGNWPEEIAAARGLAAIAMAVLIAVGASRDRDALRFSPSRAVTFQTVSLLVIGAYLLAMVGIAQWLSLAGGNFAQVMQVGFLTLAGALAILVLPSSRMRGWLRVTMAKHLFQHRYDYREEWLRFSRTMGAAGPDAAPLAKRAIKALADVTDSPAGLLLTPGEGEDLALAAHWNWPEIEVPARAFPVSQLAPYRDEAYIADLDELRRSTERALPGWLVDHPRAWALVPLTHYDRLVGLVLLARPPLARQLDWEDFDMLRVVGQQIASYLAENEGQQALADANRFDDFNRRIAFVMHDIKNLASQLSLLSRNAEMHADKKAFRDDMLVTLRNATDKLNALVARLSRYGGGGGEKVAEVAGADIVKAVAARFRQTGAVRIAKCEALQLRANAESLEQVLVHLVQNALDASAAGMPVFISLTRDESGSARIEVVDQGQGMSPEFVRAELFRPFVSTKPGGFGIGAFEARELVRAMRGTLDVESREGLGSRFIIRMPLCGLEENHEGAATRELAGAR